MNKVNRMQAWEAMWASDLSTISEYFTEDAELSGYTPPKQTTWKGVPEIIAVCDFNSTPLQLYLEDVLISMAASAFQRNPTHPPLQVLQHQTHWYSLFFLSPHPSTTLLLQNRPPDEPNQLIVFRSRTR